MASDIWLRTILIVRKDTRCRHIGYSFRLTARVLLYAPSHRQERTYHGLCYTSRGALAGTRNSPMGPPHEGSIRWPIAPWATSSRRWESDEDSLFIIIYRCDPRFDRVVLYSDILYSALFLRSVLLVGVKSSLILWFRWHCTKSSDCQVRVRGEPSNLYGVNVTKAVIGGCIYVTVVTCADTLTSTLCIQ